MNSSLSADMRFSIIASISLSLIFDISVSLSEKQALFDDKSCCIRSYTELRESTLFLKRKPFFTTDSEKSELVIRFIIFSLSFRKELPTDCISAISRIILKLQSISAI